MTELLRVLLAALGLSLYQRNRGFRKFSACLRIVVFGALGMALLSDAEYLDGLICMAFAGVSGFEFHCARTGIEDKESGATVENDRF